MPALRVERTGPGGTVARVTLARPDVHNAFDASLIAELRQTFAALAREPADRLRLVVLAGDGSSFCAGADISWMRAAMALDVEGNEQDAMAMADMFETLDTCPVPVIVRVQGAALGGGMNVSTVNVTKNRAFNVVVKISGKQQVSIAGVVQSDLKAITGRWSFQSSKGWVTGIFRFERQA